MRILRIVLLVAALFTVGSVVWSKSMAAPQRSKAAFEQMLAGLAPNADAAQLAALDRMAGQKDAIKSRLYWHTDFAQALAEAKATSKPILSLRLLGRLDEELSCANSRFFRKTLYVDPNTVALLRDRFVLHWESLRPVPILTIDYGDGRVEKRTVTGNSIHYLLDSSGRVLDAIPGLVDVPSFRQELTSFAELTTAAPVTDDRLSVYYQSVNRRAVDYARPVVPNALARNSADFSVPAMTKTFVEGPALRALRNPSDVVRTDTIQNLTAFRPQILKWIAAGEGADLVKLNDRIYRELFLAPLDDPQMGLNPPDEAALVQR